MEKEKRKNKVRVSLAALSVLLLLSLLPIADNKSSAIYGTVENSISLPGGAGNYGLVSGMYIKFDGLTGQSQDKGHQGWSKALSFSQGQSLAMAGTGSARRGNLVFDEIVILKALDKASPKLAEAVCTGQAFPKVEIHFVKYPAPHTEPTTYYAYKLEHVTVASYHIGGSSYNEMIPIERISLNFQKISVTYTEFNSAGKPISEVGYNREVTTVKPLEVELIDKIDKYKFLRK